jgi:hypothetical protein
MIAFSLTIFWGACLLFLVQPLIARFILPWFGGGPAVWTTCMLFFQVVLLGGYAYAHYSISHLRPRQQVILHLCLLAVAVCLLPITPGEGWKPVDGSHPAGHILLLLLGCLGLPYLVLSATGPLMQAWFSKAHPGASPYRLYALSNVGSLLALVAYPFLVEPNFARQPQASSWSAGLVLYAALAAWCGVTVWRRAEPAVTAGPSTEAAEAAPDRGSVFLWFALPATGVMLLLAITNKLCQDIAVVPFLWVLPLGLYLLSFIISFDSPRWYRRWLWMPLLAALLGMVLWKLDKSESHPEITGEAALYLGLLFVACMVCHGEVYRLRPGAKRLTGYYLALSAGGACGGLFVALGAPQVFPDYFELHLSFYLLAVLVLLVLRRQPDSLLQHGRGRWGWALLIPLLLAFGGKLWTIADGSLKGSVIVTRSFYGVLKVTVGDARNPETRHLTLQHGGTIHGLQFTGDLRRRMATTYYSETSGVGRLLRAHHPGHGRRVGAVGLGAGTLAAWGDEGDTFRFYEINDDVARLATNTFTYLKDSKARTELVMGDARLSMEREADQQYDIIVLDAFSSDAIPVHLLTLEAFRNYQRHLRGDGVIAVHVSNRYLDLRPIVARAAERCKYRTVTINDSESAADDDGIYASDWILLSRNDRLLSHPLIGKAASEADEVSPRIAAWTDERSDLLRILITTEGSFLGWLQGL